MVCPGAPHGNPQKDGRTGSASTSHTLLGYLTKVPHSRPVCHLVFLSLVKPIPTGAPWESQFLISFLFCVPHARLEGLRGQGPVSVTLPQCSGGGHRRGPSVHRGWVDRGVDSWVGG